MKIEGWLKKYLIEYALINRNNYNLIIIIRKLLFKIIHIMTF